MRGALLEPVSLQVSAFVYDSCIEINAWSPVLFLSFLVRYGILLLFLIILVAGAWFNIKLVDSMIGLTADLGGMFISFPPTSESPQNCPEDPEAGLSQAIDELGLYFFCSTLFFILHVSIIVDSAHI